MKLPKPLFSKAHELPGALRAVPGAGDGVTGGSASAAGGHGGGERGVPDSAMNSDANSNANSNANSHANSHANGNADGNAEGHPYGADGSFGNDGLSLPMAGVLMALGAVSLAGGAAYGLALAMPEAAFLSAPLMAALAAALGVAAAAVPLGWLLLKLGREADHTPGRGWPVDSGLPGAAGMAGLPRPLFMELATREWARARRYGSGAALLLVDVDRYARLCDARGASAGDAVMTELLRQTAPTLRTADVLTRFSSNQMAVFLAQADATGALDVAERIRERTEQLQVPWQPQPLRVTVSVGVVQLRPAHLHLQALVDDGEDAVLAARQAGGNCVRAAPLDSTRLRTLGTWRDERRAQPRLPGRPGRPG